VDGRAAAALSGYTTPSVTAGSALFAAIGEALDAERWSETDRQEMGVRIAPFLTCIPDTAEDAWVIEWVATRPEYRGKGLVHALLHDILDRGRERGHTRAQIAVLIGNTPAQRAYEGGLPRRRREDASISSARSAPRHPSPAARFNDEPCRRRRRSARTLRKSATNLRSDHRYRRHFHAVSWHVAAPIAIAMAIPDRAAKRCRASPVRTPELRPRCSTPRTGHRHLRRAKADPRELRRTCRDLGGGQVVRRAHVKLGARRRLPHLILADAWVAAEHGAEDVRVHGDAIVVLEDVVRRPWMSATR
jgi:ribosomal protein S18 acetylase RimI-like enzyme